MHCLDANVWVYYVDASLDEHDAVRDEVAGLLTDEPLFTTTVLQMEVVHYLSNRLADSAAATDRFLSLSGVAVADLTDEDVEAAVTLLEDHGQTGIGGRDASVVAAMDRCDVSQLLTHDTGLKRLGQRLDWLDVTDPVDG